MRGRQIVLVEQVSASQPKSMKKRVKVHVNLPEVEQMNLNLSRTFAH
jgi:hypothetical protein